MIPPIFVDAIIWSSLYVLLSLGLTLTYLTTKVPNFAHGTFAITGAYVSLTVSQVWNVNIYQNLYLAFIIGGIIALVQYLLVLRPLMRRGTSIVGLMIATLAIDIILFAVLNIYADYLKLVFKIRSKDFYLRRYDFQIAGQEGLLLVAPMLAVVIVTLLHLVLTRTKFGVAMRAAIEDPSLASVVGINVNFVYSVSWFISGGLAGLSGALIPLRLQSSTDTGWLLIVSIFAASIVGGLLSIYGAVLGGFLIGLAEKLGTFGLASWIGAWVLPYERLIPLIAMAVTLLIVPKGLLGADWRGLMRKIRQFPARFRSKATRKK
ncbi:MAG: branched-chain amino acid ABC transporter permease [Candidatus Bathyarchaeota archaeon]|jgi:branched-chain amino acid transport system permease protein